MSEDHKILGIKWNSTKDEVKAAFIKKMYEFREGTEEHLLSQSVRDAYKNIINGFNNNFHFLSTYTKENIKNGIECRCGSKYDIENEEDGLIECMGCSCYIEII